MANLTVKAHELKDVKVSFVSLVKRGANRIPFRVMKGEAVLDLDKFFFQKADTDAEAARAAALKKAEEAKKSDEVMASVLAFLDKNGYEPPVKKAEPASDGSEKPGDGMTSTTNPAAGSDAGGARNDGTSGFPASANDLANADAGGPRNDGGTTDLPPSRVAKADEAKADEVKAPVEKADKKKAEKPPVDDDADGDEDDNAEDDDNNDDAENKKAEKKKAEKAKKSEGPSLDDFRSLLKSHSDELKADIKEFVTKSVDAMKQEVTADFKKSENAINGKLAGLVPGQSAMGDKETFSKSDNSYPLLDTGFGHNG